MHRWFLSLCLLVAAATAVACPDDEYESCQSGCLVPNFGGGCAQGWKTCQCHKKLGGDVGKASEQAKKDFNNGVKEVQQLGQDTLTTIQKAGGNTVKTLQTAGGQIFSTLVKAGGDTVNTFVKAGQDATATYVKSWKDASEQTKRSFQDTVDAAGAVTNYTINQVKAYNTALNNADKRLREGKVLDSMWGLSIEPLQASEVNFFRATQESNLIATAASSTAALYGGPGGAAAYAAWASYRATGNADQALRTGLLAAATAQAGGMVATMPSGTMGEVLKKAAMAGAAGGIAVAAAGGDEQAIKDGFLKSAGTVLVQAGSEKARAYSPTAKDAWDTVQCISARDVDCLSKTTWAKAKGKILTDAQGKPRIDSTKLDPQQYLGKWTSFDPNSPEGKKIALLTKLSQLPKAEVIPLMKNKWTLTWTVGKSPGIKYAEPTVVLTYVGETPPFVSYVNYGESDPTDGWISTDNRSGNYDCTLAGIKRTIRTTAHGSVCDAIYRRSDGKQDLLWHSDHNSEVCAQKAIDFVAQKKVPGMQCSPI